MFKKIFNKKEFIMGEKLPYISQPKLLESMFAKVKSAKTPERFTHDFLSTVLGFKGGNYRQFIPLAKKLNFLKTDGTPTELYKKYRNEKTSKVAMASAMKHGFKLIFEKNEYAYKLDDSGIKGLVLEITGAENNDRVAQLICQTFRILKNMSDFEQNNVEIEIPEIKDKSIDDNKTNHTNSELNDFDLNLSYTINLVLPKTDDPSVYNAIFKSLKENLLRK